MPKEPKPDDAGVHEETDSPSHADDRNLYKVEKWTRDWTKVDCLLYGGNSLGGARAVFERAIRHRPRVRLTIRQRTRVLSSENRAAGEEGGDPIRNRQGAWN